MRLRERANGWSLGKFFEKEKVELYANYTLIMVKKGAKPRKPERGLAGIWQIASKSIHRDQTVTIPFFPLHRDYGKKLKKTKAASRDYPIPSCQEAEANS